MHRVIWMPTENPTGNESGVGRVGACIRHSPCLLLNRGALLAFFSPLVGGDLTGSYPQVINSQLTCLRASPPPLIQVAVHLSTHRSSGISYCRLCLTPPTTAVLERSLRFGPGLKEGIIQPGDGLYTPPFNDPSLL